MTESIEPSSSLTSTICRVMFRVGSVGTGLIAIVAGLLYAKQGKIDRVTALNY